QECDQGGAGARGRQAGEAHQVPRHRLLGIRDPRIERALVPHDAGFPERLRISPKGLERARLAAPHTRQAWTGHVAARLEGMARGARLEYSRAPRRIAQVLRSRRRGKRQGEGCRCSVLYFARLHDGSPRWLVRHATRTTAIIPACWCSSTWQWSIQLPGLSATNAISARVRGGSSTVSSHSRWRVDRPSRVRTRNT